MESQLLQIIHITIFFILSISLYLVVIPSKQEYLNYKKSRRILGFAFMLIAIMEVFRLLFPLSGMKRFLDLASIIIFSYSFTCLVFISFLYITEAARPIRQQIKKMSVICLILLVSLGITGYIWVDIRPLIKAIMSSIYLIICVYHFTTCIRTFDNLQIQVDVNHYHIKWLYPALWSTALCALIMACSFFYKPLGIVSNLLSAICYTVVTMKILSFVPANMAAAIKEIEEHKQKLAEIENQKNEGQEVAVVEEEEIKTITETAETREKKNGYFKIEPLVNKWVEDEMYTNPEISIKDAAAQMGTNSNYLSQYINKELNTSFATWLNTLRIEKSKTHLLDEDRLSIEECGMRVGYPNIYNFSRWFKIVTGMSPSEWRKLQK